MVHLSSQPDDMTFAPDVRTTIVQARYDPIWTPSTLFATMKEQQASSRGNRKVQIVEGTMRGSSAVAQAYESVLLDVLRDQNR